MFLTFWIVQGEGEINAATTITGLLESPKFDLTSTYFLIIGIAGINPNVGSIGDVTFARYAVQVALQYQFDIRDLPCMLCAFSPSPGGCNAKPTLANYSIGYIPLGSTAPGEYPQELYGTEVFELNKDLMDRAMELARKAKLNDTDSAVQLRYASSFDNKFCLFFIILLCSLSALVELRSPSSRSATDQKVIGR